MMQAYKIEGSLYPIVVVKGRIPEQFFEILDGVSYRKQEHDGHDYFSFPFWHIERLSRFFGPPANDYGKQLLRSLQEQEQVVKAIRDGNHPLIQQAPSYFYQHQKKAWALAVLCRTFAFYLEQGLGKTAIMIELMRIPTRRFPTLIVCPVTLIRGAWIPELRLRGPELTVANLHENPHLALEHYDVYLLNKEKLSRNAAVFHQMMRHRLKRVIVDESSCMKNPEAKLTDAMATYFGTVEERYLLSGTPAPNGPNEYWGQINFLRPGLLPVTYKEYLDTYFTQKYRSKYVIRPGSMEAVMDKISSCSISMTKDDCLDLPKKRFIPRYVTLPEQTKVAYNQLKERLKQEIFQLQGQGKRSGSMFAQIMKLREITSGFIVTHKKESRFDKDTGMLVEEKKSVWNFVSDHKFQMLKELLEDIGDQQVIIWMNFVKDFHMLSQLFPALKNKIGYIYGEVKSQEVRSDVIEAFKSGRLQYIAANPASLGHGVTLINPVNPCANVIYYDLDYSLEKFEQSQDRVHRIGQTRSVAYYPILAEDTIDETIWARLASKKETLSDAMEYLK